MMTFKMIVLILLPMACHHY